MTLDVRRSSFDVRHSKSWARQAVRELFLDLAPVCKSWTYFEFTLSLPGFSWASRQLQLVCWPGLYANCVHDSLDWRRSN